ncbi:hypothetical protein HGRIS_014298 [Hohenbuehelia grisea]|uniref:Uncharacterized protein n=1 Tax=Hohenbuehelia grisea TaxID=104357 RepID=A0ABR3JT37_9AGAR
MTARIQASPAPIRRSTAMLASVLAYITGSPHATRAQPSAYNPVFLGCRVLPRTMTSNLLLKAAVCAVLALAAAAAPVPTFYNYGVCGGTPPASGPDGYAQLPSKPVNKNPVPPKAIPPPPAKDKLEKVAPNLRARYAPDWHTYIDPCPSVAKHK